MFEPHALSQRPPRSEWLRCWSALPAPRLQALAAQLEQLYRVECIQPTAAGLGLLPWREAALGEVFFLGEIPLTQAWVRLHSADQQRCEGAATLMDDRTNLARALAVLDAVTAAHWPGSDQAEELLQLGAQALQRTDATRRTMLAQTRVNFSTMGTADDDEELPNHA
jgi:alpha-D-ribose 1-methylphosphonate 5-triphosphate synthase subunit PhnG